MSAWYVYLLRCHDGSYYTGISTDPRRRLRQHNGELAGGARYTRCRRPVELVHVEAAADRSAAAVREYQLRRSSAATKRRLAAAGSAKPIDDAG